MGKKLIPKIILEGTRLTYKTEIAFMLNEHPEIVGPRKYRYHSPVISAEWCAFTNFPWGRGLINFLPDEASLAMETYHTWVRLFELQKYYSWIIDRFHISTQVYQKTYHGMDYDFMDVEKRLNTLGFHLVFMTRTPESFESARKERLEISGNPSQYDDLSIFQKEQTLMKTFITQSSLPVLTLDISDNDKDKAVKSIVQWLRQTGGLYGAG